MVPRSDMVPRYHTLISSLLPLIIVRPSGWKAHAFTHDVCPLSTPRSSGATGARAALASGALSATCFAAAAGATLSGSSSWVLSLLALDVEREERNGQHNRAQQLCSLCMIRCATTSPAAVCAGSFSRRAPGCAGWGARAWFAESRGRKSQTRTVLSVPALATSDPSGLTATQITEPACPVSSRHHSSPFFRSQIRTVVSTDPLTSSSPSELNAIALIQCVWPRSVVSSSPVASRQILIRLSRPPDATRVPSGEHATALTCPSCSERLIWHGKASSRLLSHSIRRHLPPIRSCTAGDSGTNIFFTGELVGSCIASWKGASPIFSLRSILSLRLRKLIAECSRSDALENTCMACESSERRSTPIPLVSLAVMYSMEHSSCTATSSFPAKIWWCTNSSRRRTFRTSPAPRCSRLPCSTRGCRGTILSAALSDAYLPCTSFASAGLYRLLFPAHAPLKNSASCSCLRRLPTIPSLDSSQCVAKMRMLLCFHVNSWYPLASTRSETNGESSASAASASCAGMTRTGGMWLVRLYAFSIASSSSESTCNISPSDTPALAYARQDAIARAIPLPCLPSTRESRSHTTSLTEHPSS
mmetsp:Transcript_45781/g.108555  ORF Transcript_45781/g.108555 Transcript_45781/m.108555 type:complete len:589 (-) Transcript_45781:2618-4384(-)